jgi:diguanylate cyclase (GGDEF)-like protein
VPAQVINKGIPTAGLLAEVLVAKYSDHLPLYHQELIFGRAGLTIPHSTLTAWVGTCGVQLQPLVDALRNVLLQHNVLHADETPVSMLAPGKKKTHRAYVWAYCTTPFSDLSGVIYEFAPSRHQHHDSPWHTQALGETALAPWQEGDLCGLLAVALPTETTQWLMLFRREQRHNRRWAGKPEDTLMMRDGRLVMMPRRSFAQWQEEVKGRSHAWRTIECRTVGDLTKALAVLTSNHEIVQLNEKLKSLAYSDGLTGVWNRYRMEQAFEAEINAAERHDRPFAVLLFDIDHFKHFNDTYGHEAGDEVLVMLSSVLQNKLRPTDNLGRWGGEEFLVLASDCNLAGGMNLAERLRKSAEALDLGGTVWPPGGPARAPKPWSPGLTRRCTKPRKEAAIR